MQNPGPCPRTHRINLHFNKIRTLKCEKFDREETLPWAQRLLCGPYDLSQLPVSKDRAIKANNSTSKGSFQTNMYQIIIKYIKIRILSSHRNSLLPVLLFLSLPTKTAPLPDFRPSTVLYFHSPK